jgi:chromosome transmission fidelity protein 1
MAVMGGKLSEGINLSDDLARCLIIVGLPFPNKYHPEMSEKMRYYNSLDSSIINGQIYYQNCCWKTVNQTIGRAIRHQKDHAAIMLVDE